MPIALTSTHHDPHGQLADQLARVLPTLRAIFPSLVVLVSDETPASAIAPLHAPGCIVHNAPPVTYHEIGAVRRAAVEYGLAYNAERIWLVDFDRVLHWAEYHPAELAQLAQSLVDDDFVVLGRTVRAFASHPRAQIDTETIINDVFARVCGQPWDITAAARVLSRRAAAAILAGCADTTIGTDASWPLFLLRHGGFTIQHYKTEGLEFETLDRFAPAEAAGGLARFDTDPATWMQRLETARIEVAAMVPYTRQ